MSYHLSARLQPISLVCAFSCKIMHGQAIICYAYRAETQILQEGTQNFPDGLHGLPKSPSPYGPLTFATELSGQATFSQTPSVRTLLTLSDAPHYGCEGWSYYGPKHGCEGWSLPWL